MGAAEKLKSNVEQIKRLGNQYGARNVRVFGSVARGEDGANSDIDLLVSLDPSCTLLDLGGFQAEVAALLSCKVDVISDDSLHPLLKDKILKEAKAL
jgi:uncharacterized protein